MPRSVLGFRTRCPQSQDVDGSAKDSLSVSLDVVDALRAQRELGIYASFPMFL